MFLINPIILSVTVIITSFLILRFLSKTSLLYVLKNWWRLLEDKFHAYQSYRVPQFNQHMQENQLYRKVYTYLNSLPCIEDSDFANLFSGNKSSDISLVLDSNQTISDTFLSARVYWTNENKTLALKIRRKDKRRILRPYLQHIHRVFDEIEQRRKEVCCNFKPSSLELENAILCTNFLYKLISKRIETVTHLMSGLSFIINTSPLICLALLDKVFFY